MDQPVPARGSPLAPWSGRLGRRLRQLLYRRLYRDVHDGLDRTLLIAGAARSGTTWLAEMVASELSARLVFEPFHSRLVAEFGRFHYFHYMRAADEDAQLLDFSRRVLSGRLRHPWVDRYVETLRPRARVVKEIRANLFLRWLALRFPELPLVFLLRHPCAVVASRLSLGWATDTDLEPLLAQPRLVADFLAERLPLIEAARRPEEKHAVIWCVSNLVPLSQFPPEELALVFYEDLCRDPRRELRRLLGALDHPVEAGTRVDRPSMTTPRRTTAPQRRIDAWRNELSTGQVDAVLRIVRDFGLADLYGEGAEPLESARARGTALP